jgi:DNA-binding response OmpR family regulator
MSKGRILVVEDESIVALDIRRILGEGGFEVVASVPSGEEAVATAALLRPDLVLMDIRLQGAMNGIEAARRIRDESRLPALFLTSYVDQQMLAQAKGMDAVGYVLKPFDERELVVAVEMALHRWQMEESLRLALSEAGGRPPAVRAGADGAVPELEIRTLGRLEILLQGRVVARAEDFSRTLRSLFGLLLTAPNLRVRQEEVQLALWPESSPDKARSSFDSLLLRLRRTLDAALQPHPARAYLTLQRGILCLKNSRVDVIEFIRLNRRGQELAKRGQNDEARAAFSAAFGLWEGVFVLATTEVERLREFDDELAHLHLDLVLRWTELLAAAGELDTACEVLNRSLAGDRTNDALVKALYRNCLRQNNPAKAAEVTRQYEEALGRAGFSPREIRDALTGLAASS